jgi:hypothetical protein
MAKAAVTRKNLTPEQAVDEAIKRVKAILDRYEVR